MKHPTQPVYVDSYGTYKFQTNAIVKFLLDSGKFSLNNIAAMPFSVEDRQQFAQLIGYSVSGYKDLSYVDGDAEDAADAAVLEMKMRVKDVSREKLP